MYQMLKGGLRNGAAVLGVTALVPLALAGSVAAAEAPMAQESIFSDSLRFTGRVVATLEDGREIRENAFLRGRLFHWKGRLEGLRPAPEERPDGHGRRPDIAAMGVEELAEALRGVAMFQGHMFVEAKPPLALARKVKRLERLRREGGIEALRRELPAVPPSYGEAGRLEEEGEAELAGGVSPQAVIGTDDRTVMNNLVYPHRAHIVFDNAGSRWVIESSQGSGSLIGPSTAMSVAHVFWDEARDTWEATHRWAPGYDSADADPSPWGEWTGCYWVTIPSAYTNGNDEFYDYAVLDFDVGCNSVRNGVNSDRPGSTVGWLGHYTASASEIESRTGYLRGYPGTGTCGNPGQSCGTRVWGDVSRSSENNVPFWWWDDHRIEYQADSSGGQSGSAFYHYADPTCAGCGYGAYLVGMHFHGHGGSYNDARRFDSTVLSFMRAYSSDY
ncbi:MAG TPA: hypothetical protein ENK54_02395 [Thiotrichales bacterium]|nr:hypothetical protein [Thiotrichales bacterium]